MNVHDAQKVYTLLHSNRDTYRSGVDKLFQFDWYNTSPSVLSRLNLHPFITKDSDIYNYDDFDTFRVLVSGKLTTDGFDSEKILKVLELTSSIIVGSYIIQAISNDMWPTDCIDILHSGTDVPTDLQDYFTEMGYTAIQPTRLTKYGELIHFMGHNERRCVRIMVTKEPVTDFIRRIDLDICRIYYPCDQRAFNSEDVKIMRHMIENKEMRITSETKMYDNGEWEETLRKILKFIRRGFLMKNWNMITIKKGTPEFELRWNLTVFSDFDCNREDSSLPVLVNGKAIFYNDNLERIIKYLEYLRDTQFQSFMQDMYPAYSRSGDTGLEYYEVDENMDTGELTSVTFDFVLMEDIQKTACGEVIVGGIDRKHSYCVNANDILDPLLYDAKITASNQGQLDKIMFECIRHTNGRQTINLFNPYLYIIVGESGARGIVKLAQYQKAREHHLFHGRKSIYLKPILDSTGKPVSIRRLTSFRNSGISLTGLDYVSANHCQAGSDMQLYQIIVCKGDKCL